MLSLGAQNRSERCAAGGAGRDKLPFRLGINTGLCKHVTHCLVRLIPRGDVHKHPALLVISRD